MRFNSITISADRSGSGKTTFTCALMNILIKRGYTVCSFKCGPDYIDPMYHRMVLGIPSGNLDSYFTTTDVIKRIAAQKYIECNAQISVIEGAMGYYDGVGGVSVEGSCYEISSALGSPVILLVNASAVSVSLAALISGLIGFRKDNKISGVILNRVTHNFYPRLKSVIEKECGVRVLGYLPPGMPGLPSRHLGLVAPEELTDFTEWVDAVSKQVEETVDIDAVAALAGGFVFDKPSIVNLDQNNKCTVAVARDEAFSFYYEENLNLLERLGARLIYFSPMRDEAVPEEADGMLLGGGYPEVYAKELSDNKKLLRDIRLKIEGGMPLLAECGGFLYLQKILKGTDGCEYEMAGFFDGTGAGTGALKRFGYLEAHTKVDSVLGPAGTAVRGHEFHHWDVGDPGCDAHAVKPFGDDYECMKCGKNYAAGFMHMYYESNPDAVSCFIKKCAEYGEKNAGT